MFEIGSEQWPGISKLVEECGEVLQVAGKLMGTQGKVEHWDGEGPLNERLQNEMADVIAAIEFVIKHSGLDRQAVATRAAVKFDLFEAWHAKQTANSLRR